MNDILNLWHSRIDDPMTSKMSTVYGTAIKQTDISLVQFRFPSHPLVEIVIVQQFLDPLQTSKQFFDVHPDGFSDFHFDTAIVFRFSQFLIHWLVLKQMSQPVVQPRLWLQALPIGSIQPLSQDAFHRLGGESSAWSALSQVQPQGGLRKRLVQHTVVGWKDKKKIEWAKKPTEIKTY